MKYPDWVHEPQGQTEQQARKKRLVYLVRRAALHIDGRGSYSALAEKLGLCHSTFCIYIDRGRFSAATATAIEKLVGRELAPHELLMDPLGEVNQ